MSGELKQQIDVLVKLQEIESNSYHIREKIESVTQTVQVLEEELSQQENQIAQQTGELDELRKIYRSMEKDVQTNQDTMKKNQGKLHSVKSNKEYQAILKGIEDLKVKNSRIEDEMLTCLDKIEETEAKVNSVKADYSKLQKEVNEKKKEIEKETKDGEKKLVELDSKKNSVSKQADENYLNTFNQVKQRISIEAVVPVRDAICLGCNMNIPPQLYNELKYAEHLTFCPNCQRIIYRETG